MKNIWRMALLALLSGIPAGCLSGVQVREAAERQAAERRATDWQPEVILTLAQAESILGEKARLSESAAYLQNAVRTYASTYQANSPDRASGKTGALYFMLEEYPDVAAATVGYAGIWDGNKAHEGIQQLADLGDQAYFHSDGSHFLFVLARKGRQMIRLKVNKITSQTSKDAFMDISRALTEAL
ncbi:MAG: hypothetical protein ACAI44_18275 [Candidatus Sericytochromatia bacterium]